MLYAGAGGKKRAVVEAVLFNGDMYIDSAASRTRTFTSALDDLYGPIHPTIYRDAVRGVYQSGALIDAAGFTYALTSLGLDPPTENELKRHFSGKDGGGAKSTTATRSLALPIIHVWCPFEACKIQHVVKAKQIEVNILGKKYTQYRIFCREGGTLSASERRQTNRVLKRLRLAELPGHGPTLDDKKACIVCQKGGY